jgi:Ca2+-binding EF-hand superfamily protein
VHKIFAKYDKDRSGFLDKPEVLKLLDEILIHKGRPKTTWEQFIRFFNEFDDNGDGVISKDECYNFVNSFMNKPQRPPSPKVVYKQTPSEVTKQQFEVVLDRVDRLETRLRA